MLANAIGGTLDFTKSRTPRTVTTLKIAEGMVLYDSEVLTIGTLEVYEIAGALMLSSSAT